MAVLKFRGDITNKDIATVLELIAETIILDDDKVDALTDDVKRHFENIVDLQDFPVFLRVTENISRRTYTLSVRNRNPTREKFYTDKLTLKFESSHAVRTITNGTLVSYNETNGELIIKPNLDGAGIAYDETDVLKITFNATPTIKLIGYEMEA